LSPISLECIAERLYEWSLREAAREMERKFSLVRLVKGENAEKYVRFFDQLPATDTFLASQALVKRMNQPGLLRQKSGLTGSEEKYVQAYLQFEEISGPGGFRIVAGPRQPTVVRTVELRKTLKALVKERFRPEFGPPERLSANEWIYEADAGCIRVRTYLDVGGRSSLSYSHRALQRDGTPLRAHLSLLQWLGAASMTRWRALRAEELLDAADAVLTLSQHFVREMKALFAG
jgi:hypothetical protein